MWHSASEGRADPRDAVVPFGREPTCRYEGFSDLLATRMRYKRNTKIFDEDDSADCFYRVLGGGVRMVKLTSDGRRQITAFYLSGDMFGLDAEIAHRFSAEAFGVSDVLIIRRGDPLAQGTCHPQFMLMLWSRPSRNCGARKIIWCSWAGRTHRSALPPSCWIWLTGYATTTLSIYRCRAWTSPTILASPSKRSRAR